eukprot:TRINITY_DN126_c0_g1_i1.p1 TRINITY_DN126_c0_g1~~TRINITY_DN126_c0_g1_i1.p1  ORF type:complete len:602 (+),score=132.08 TRINITY_DN126_c0_g1_i1:71-1876(+)
MTLVANSSSSVASSAASTPDASSSSPLITSANLEQSLPKGNAHANNAPELTIKIPETSSAAPTVDAGTIRPASPTNSAIGVGINDDINCVPCIAAAKRRAASQESTTKHSHTAAVEGHSHEEKKVVELTVQIPALPQVANPPTSPQSAPCKPCDDFKLQKSFHRRCLPCPPAISFSSQEGQKIFRMALESGHLDGYFQLAEQFTTQMEPSFCGLASLCVVLNALEVDPQRIWKGGWRWFSETMLDCCVPIAQIEKDGITFPQMVCLAKNHGLDAAKVGRGEDVEAFRNAVKEATHWNAENPQDKKHMIVSYSRKTFEQSGDGHFSPIGGYCPEKDLVLILDVARFKYPPHWVSLEKLCASMQQLDPVTKKPRGWMLLSVREDEPDPETPKIGNRTLHFVLMTGADNDWNGLSKFLGEKIRGISSCPCGYDLECKECNEPGPEDDPESKRETQTSHNNCFCALAAEDFVAGVSAFVKHYGINYVPPEIQKRVDSLKGQLRNTDVYKLFFKVMQGQTDIRPVKALGAIDLAAEYVSILFLAMPKKFWEDLKPDIPCKHFFRTTGKDLYVDQSLLYPEISALRKQMTELIERSKHSMNRCCGGQ